MANFFIDRPVFSWVIAIIIMLAGGLSLKQLPIEQYPAIAPPEVKINAVYFGASAQTVENTVTQVIEQQMKGIDNLLYFSSTSDSTGSVSISLSFLAGTDPDIAQVQVQNKLQLAMPSLPADVQRQGVSVSKSSANFLMVVGLYSEDDSMSVGGISDYMYSYLLDPISRVEGVGNVTVFGAQYAMRVWCNPEKFKEYGLVPSDVIQAIQAQNAQTSSGQIGAAPFVKGQEINFTIEGPSLLESVDDFENIFLRILPDGSHLLLKDVARIELASERFFSESSYNGKTASALGIELSSGANALETANLVKAKIEELSAFFPSGLKVVYPYDSSPFVRISIDGVYSTLFEAIVLVFFVMYLFLQDFRATLIPTLAIPVVLLGTFGILFATGFTVNTLTMFAMVLAIGLLVDDAIVVVENVERLMREEGLSPKDAAKKSMQEITGALVGIGLVLSAIFVPMAFIGGSTGVIFRQFSVTIVSAMLLSVFVAIFFTPMLCASFLKEHVSHERKGFFGKFNTWFDNRAIKYQKLVGGLLGKPFRCFVAYVVILITIASLFVRLPSSFFPDEDQGMIFVLVQLPAGATFERTEEVMAKVTNYFLEDEKEAVDGVMAIKGFSFAGNGQNMGTVFVRLRDWDKRTSNNLKAKAVAERAFLNLIRIKEGFVFATIPPAVLELGNATGFVFQLIDKSGAGHEALVAAGNQLMGMATSTQPIEGAGDVPPAFIISQMRQNGMPDMEQLKLEIDVNKAGAYGVNVKDINSTISAFWGSFYINDFLDRNKIKKVYLQADTPFRMQAQDFDKYFVRSSSGDMVPVSTFLTIKNIFASPRLERFNGESSLQYQGQAAFGKSSGDAMNLMENLAKNLPKGFDYAWSGLSYQEKLSGDQAPVLYGLSLIVVFLCLAALYESWSIPFSVLLVAPLGLLGTVLGTMLRGLDNDIYFQVGLLTVIGLSAKNSILIVEFAKELIEEGRTVMDATLEAVKIRLRPILMTSMAFVLGVTPLAISSGAGSGAQNAIGTAVVAGTLMATFLGLLATPLFFYLVISFFENLKSKKEAKKMGGSNV